MPILWLKIDGLWPLNTGGPHDVVIDLTRGATGRRADAREASEQPR
jgi:hypothetical protein